LIIMTSVPTKISVSGQKSLLLYPQFSHIVPPSPSCLLYRKWAVLRNVLSVAYRSYIQTTDLKAKTLLCFEKNQLRFATI
jgi:hypothetical protein